MKWIKLELDLKVRIWKETQVKFYQKTQLPKTKHMYVNVHLSYKKKNISLSYSTIRLGRDIQIFSITNLSTLNMKLSRCLELKSNFK